MELEKENKERRGAVKEEGHINIILRGWTIADVAKRMDFSPTIQNGIRQRLF